MVISQLSRVPRAQASELTIVLLSNAVHRTYRKDGMGDSRPAFHDLVVKFSDCIFKPAQA